MAMVREMPVLPGFRIVRETGQRLCQVIDKMTQVYKFRMTFEELFTIQNWHQGTMPLKTSVKYTVFNYELIAYQKTEHVKLACTHKVHHTDIYVSAPTHHAKRGVLYGK